MRGRERGREDIGHHANTVIYKEVLSCSDWSSSVRNNGLRGRGSWSLAIGRIVFLEFFTGFLAVTRGGISSLSAPATIVARNRRGLSRSRWIVLLLVLGNFVLLAFDLECLSALSRSVRGGGKFEKPIAAVREGKIGFGL